MWLRLFVLAIVSLRFSPLKPFDFGLFDCGLVNFSRSVESPAIEGIGAQFRVSPTSGAETVLPLLGLVRWGGHGGQCESNGSRSRHAVCVDAVESTAQSL